MSVPVRHSTLQSELMKLYWYFETTRWWGCRIADVTSSIGAKKKKQQQQQCEENKTRGDEKEAQKFVAMWALSECGLGKMSDHTYCTLHDKKRQPSVSERRRRARDRRRHKTRINIGVALPKWKSVMVANGFHNNADVALFLLDRWASFVFCLPTASPENVWRARVTRVVRASHPKPLDWKRLWPQSRKNLFFYFFLKQKPEIWWVSNCQLCGTNSNQLVTTSGKLITINGQLRLHLYDFSLRYGSVILFFSV